MEPQEHRHIKTMAIQAIFSSSMLMNRLVLKGANLLDIVYGIRWRSSLDVDCSMADEFDPSQLDSVGHEIETCLRRRFAKDGYEVFDVLLTEKPKKGVTPDMADFWGGYEIEFKILEKVKFEELGSNLQAKRRYAAVVGPKNSTKFRIDISKSEYCQPKRQADVSGTRVYVYTPEMILFEKLRAICQQLPQYSQEVNSPSRKARARDFFDIYAIGQEFQIELDSPDNIELLRNIFNAKRVPLRFLGLVATSREYHRSDFDAVVATVADRSQLQSYDFYFDDVCKLCERLKPLWKE